MSAPPADTPVAPKASLWEDFVDIFYAPSLVFERRRDGRFWPALVVFTLVMTALFVALRPAFQPMFDAQLELAMQRMAAQGSTPEQIAGARQMGEKFANVGAIVGAFVSWPAAIFLTGLALWLAGKFFDAAASLRQTVTIAAYANIPRVLGLAAAGGIAFVSDPERLRTPYAMTVTPAHFAPADTPLITQAFLSRFDPFTLWTTALLGVGLAVIARLPRGRAFMAAAVVWLLGTLMTIAGAARQAAG